MTRSGSRRNAVIGIALAIIAATVGIGPHAFAQTEAQTITDLAGKWWIYPTDGAPGCGVLLSKVSAGRERWGATPDAICAARIPATKGVAAWRPLDGMVLLDASGTPLMSFVEDETALPSSPDLIAPRYYFVPAIPGVTRVMQPLDFRGTWTLSKARAGACTLVFQAGPAYATAPRRVIRPGKGCTRQNARINSWSTEVMQLLLTGPGDDMIMFSSIGPDRYRAVTGGWTLTRATSQTRKGPVQ